MGTPSGQPSAPRGRLVALGALVLVLGVASLSIGSLHVPFGETVRILLEGSAPQPSPAEVAIMHFRIPRTAVIVLTGLSLGIAGAVTQGVTRNPLADPGLLGISAGAALAVVVGVSFLSISSPLPQLALAFIGAAIAAAVVFFLGAAGGRAASPIALVISGAAVSAFLVAITTTLVLRNSEAMDRYRFWSTGSVSATDSAEFVPAIAFMIVGAVAAFATARSLDLLAMGEASAQSLGMNIRRTRSLSMVAVTLLAGSATAIAGPIAFLGLIAPHLARALSGPDYRRIIPVSALCAVAVLFLADILGRVIAYREVSAGIMMVLVGVPFFLLTVRRSRFVQA